MNDEKRPKRQVVNGDKKLQGWVSEEDKKRVEFLLEKGYILNESDAVRAGTRALWREYLAGNLEKIKTEDVSPPKDPVPSST